MASTYVCMKARYLRCLDITVLVRQPWFRCLPVCSSLPKGWQMSTDMTFLNMILMKSGQLWECVLSMTSCLICLPLSSIYKFSRISKARKRQENKAMLRLKKFWRMSASGRCGIPWQRICQVAQGGNFQLQLLYAVIQSLSCLMNPHLVWTCKPEGLFGIC